MVLQVHKEPIHFIQMIGCVVENPDGSSALAVRRTDCSETASKAPAPKSLARLSDALQASSEGTSSRICAPQDVSHSSFNESAAAWDNPVYVDPCVLSHTDVDVHATEAANSEEQVQAPR